MFGVTYQHDILRKYNVIFGALFNDIRVNRTDTGGIVQTLKVPIGYGPKEKFLARVYGNPDGLHEGKPAISLPRIAFQMSNLSYDSSRKLQNVGRTSVVDPANNQIRISTYNPVPYNIEYTVWVMVKNATDGTRIIEQILPMFRPQYTIEAEIIASMQLDHDIPIVLNQVGVDDQYEGDWKERRHLIWTLKFTLKGFLYGQLRNTGLIKLAQTSIYSSMSTANQCVIISVQPGLTANGNPTTNINETVPYTAINENDNWDYIVQIDEDV